MLSGKQRARIAQKEFSRVRNMVPIYHIMSTVNVALLSIILTVAHMDPQSPDLKSTSPDTAAGKAYISHCEYFLQT